VGPEPVWIGAENLAPPGFDPRTFQPVASRYTDCAIPAPNRMFVLRIILTKQVVFISSKPFQQIGSEMEMQYFLSGGYQI
jgi:hypothetical protein